MAVQETLQKVTIQPRLNDGTDSSGNIKTVTASMGSTLAVEPFRANMSSASEKALNIIEALSVVWAKTVYNVGRVVTSNIDRED